MFHRSFGIEVGLRVSLVLVALAAAACDRPQVPESVATLHQPLPYSGKPTGQIGDDCETYSGAQCAGGFCLATTRGEQKAYVCTIECAAHRATCPADWSCSNGFCVPGPTATIASVQQAGNRR